MAKKENQFFLLMTVTFSLCPDYKQVKKLNYSLLLIKLQLFQLIVLKKKRDQETLLYHSKSQFCNSTDSLAGLGKGKGRKINSYLTLNYVKFFPGKCDICGIW